MQIQSFHLPPSALPRPPSGDDPFHCSGFHSGVAGSHFGNSLTSSKSEIFLSRDEKKVSFASSAEKHSGACCEISNLVFLFYCNKCCGNHWAVIFSIRRFFSRGDLFDFQARLSRKRSNTQFQFAAVFDLILLLPFILKIFFLQLVFDPLRSLMFSM